ncbi:hypothetical protein IWX50DRAFT_640167 [Phyllosticta citricarpa]
MVMMVVVVVVMGTKQGCSVGLAGCCTYFLPRVACMGIMGRWAKEEISHSSLIFDSLACSLCCYTPSTYLPACPRAPAEKNSSLAADASHSSHDPSRLVSSCLPPTCPTLP